MTAHRIYRWDPKARRSDMYFDAHEYADVTMLPGAEWSYRLRHYRWLRRMGMNKYAARLTFWREITPQVERWTVELGTRELVEVAA